MTQRMTDLNIAKDLVLGILNNDHEDVRLHVDEVLKALAQSREEGYKEGWDACLKDQND